MGNYFDYEDFYNNAWREVDSFFEGVTVKRDMPELLNCKNEDEVREFAFDYADKKVDWFADILEESDTGTVDLPEELKEKYMAKVRTHVAEGCISMWEVENQRKGRLEMMKIGGDKAMREIERQRKERV